VVGIRRALGASRLQIFIQHLVHAGVLALAGSLLGLGLTALLLWGVRAMYGGDPDARSGGYQALAHFNVISLVWVTGLAVAAALVAGLYPAWRIGRVPPALYLKSQ